MTPPCEFKIIPDRELQIEADGDSWNGLAKPKIRLMGRWLERAGFRPGSRVQVTCVAPGVIELRSPDSPTWPETVQPRPARLEVGVAGCLATPV